MGYKHTREDILSGALTAAIEDGLSKLTFGSLAKRLEVSDRIIVYYFPTKKDLIGEVIGALGVQVQEALLPAFSIPAKDHRDMAQRAWPLLATPENDPVFALFFEANGLAAVGLEPYATIVPTLIDGWADWASTLLAESNEQRAEANAAIAIIDGLLLLRQLIGGEAANQAATTLLSN